LHLFLLLLTEGWEQLHHYQTLEVVGLEFWVPVDLWAQDKEVVLGELLKLLEEHHHQHGVMTGKQVTGVHGHQVQWQGLVLAGEMVVVEEHGAMVGVEEETEK
jgi:hypothetical protein